MKIDKIFIINLENRTDRKAEVLNEMIKMKANDLCEIEVFKAIRPNNELLEKWNPNFLDPMPQWAIQKNINPNIYKIGALGCLLSHLTIIQKSLSLGYENILIFEDDAEFLSSKKDLKYIINKYGNFILKFLNNFGIFYLGGNNSRLGMRHLIENIYLTYGTFTTSSYIINKKCMQFIVDKIIGYPKEIDKFYCELIQPNFQCITLHPPIVTQRKSYSDILNQETDYDLKTLKTT
jgi:glycosyl transferase family 25